MVIPSRSIVAALESIAMTLVQRRWAMRSAIVTEVGEVLGLFYASQSSDPTGTNPSDANARGVFTTNESNTDLVAKIAVEVVDHTRWLYVDLTSVRLLAKVATNHTNTEAIQWLVEQLQRLGVTVEGESIPRE